jgi:hypothetical protein
VLVEIPSSLTDSFLAFEHHTGNFLKLSTRKIPKVIDSIVTKKPYQEPGNIIDKWWISDT